MTVTDVLHFFNFLLFAAAPVMWAALYWDMRPEKTFLPALLLNSLFCYIFAAFHCMQYGFPLLYSANLLLYIPVVIRWKRLGLQLGREKICTPGAAILFIFAVLAFFFESPKILSSWDAVSHWGTVTKFFLEEGKLGCEYPFHVLKHSSYPPGLSMTTVLVHKCFFGKPYSDGLAIFSHMLYDLGAIAWLFAAFSWNEKKRIFAWLLPVSLLLPFLYALRCFDFCWADSELALLMAITFYHMIKQKDYRAQDIFILALMTSWMFMVRNAGWGYAIGIMVMFAIQLYLDRERAFRDAAGKFSALKTSMAALVFLLPLLLKYSWVLLLKYHHTTIHFSGARITPAGMSEKFGSPGASGWWMLLSFLVALCWGYIESFILWIWLSCREIKRSIDPFRKRGLKMMLFFFTIGFTGFLTTLFIYYIFEFVNDPQQVAFPSLPRYVNSFLMIPVAVLLLLCSEKKSGCCSGDWSLKKWWLFSFAAILLGFSVLNYPFSWQKKYITWRKECEIAGKYDHLIKRPGIKFAGLHQGNNGFKPLYMQYLYPSNFHQTGFWDPVLPEKRTVVSRRHATAITPDELLDKLAEADYIFIDYCDAEFVRDYRQIFAVPPTGELKHEMFRIDHRNRKLEVAK